MLLLVSHLEAWLNLLMLCVFDLKARSSNWLPFRVSDLEILLPFSVSRNQNRLLGGCLASLLEDKTKNTPTFTSCSGKFPLKENIFELYPLIGLLCTLEKMSHTLHLNTSKMIKKILKRFSKWFKLPRERLRYWKQFLDFPWN